MNKTIIFRYFNIRIFEIPKYRSFYIWSFQILYPTQLAFLQKFPVNNTFTDKKIVFLI